MIVDFDGMIISIVEKKVNPSQPFGKWVTPCLSSKLELIDIKLIRY